jgi:hypothetical protein
MMFATNQSWTITPPVEPGFASPIEDKPVDPVAYLKDDDESFESLIASYHTR